VLNGGPLISLFNSYDFEPGATYVAAISGGSDSTALLFLLKTHFEKFHPDARLIAATVDHGLRVESADEARTVGKLCHELGIEHRILEWSGEKPKRGIQAAARLARHSLLAELALREGAKAVFTGHTRDDQAETVLMRSARGDGHGSAGIAPATLHAGQIWFVRPLLGASRAQLREKLASLGIGWLDDPSNSDARYERARLRVTLANSPEGLGLVDAAIAEAAEAGALRRARSMWAAGLLRRHATRVASGLIRLDTIALSAPNETLLHALRALVAASGGSEHLPDRDRATALMERLRQGNARATLARALVDSRKNGVYFLREVRGLPSDVPAAGEIWDRRYKMIENKNPWRVDSSRYPDIPESLVRAAALAQPVVSHGRVAKPLVAPWSQFLPIFDWAIANEVARLVDADAFPALPFRGHIEKTT